MTWVDTVLPLLAALRLLVTPTAVLGCASGPCRGDEMIELGFSAER